MPDYPLAPYLLWAKTRQPAAVDLAGSNLLHCTLDELPGAREAVDLAAPNDNGFPPLVDALAQHYGIARDWIAMANGCSGANFLAIAATVSAGDHVLVERPGYDPLLGACRLVGARIERFERRVDVGYRLDVDDLARRVTPTTRLIIVTTPHNPSGVLLDDIALRELGALADRTGASVLVDEVYLDAAMIAGGLAATSRSAARLDGPFVVTSSLTKSYGLAGLRCGWVVAAPPLAERIRRTRDVVDNAGSGPADRLAALAFSRLAHLTERTRRLLAANLERARRFFNAHPLLQIVEPPRASVAFPRIAGVSDSEAFVRHALDRHGVAVAPGRFFEAPAHFRISLAGNPETIEAGLDRLAAALNEI